MSRSGYTDEWFDSFEYGRWRHSVDTAISGKRGQAFLRELLEALDGMENKQLHSGSFATAEGEFCTLGVLGSKRGTKMDDLGDEDDCEPKIVGERFGIARAMAAEIMYLNDECLVDEYKWVDFVICGPVRPYYPDYGRHSGSVRVANDNHPADRWKAMRKWVVENLKSNELAGGIEG